MQTEEICGLRDRSLSKRTPKLRVESVGVISEPWKEMEDAVVSLERCCGLPMIKYSVLEGLTVLQLTRHEQSQELRKE